MRRDIEGAQIGHMIGGVIGLIFANHCAAAGLLGFGLEHDLRSAASRYPSRPRFLQLLDFTLEFGFLLKAIVTGPATHDFAAFPILKDTVHVFASNSGHGREVALPDFVLNDDAVRSDISPTLIRQFAQ